MMRKFRLYKSGKNSENTIQGPGGQALDVKPTGHGQHRAHTSSLAWDRFGKLALVGALIVIPVIGYALRARKLA